MRKAQPFPLTLPNKWPGLGFLLCGIVVIPRMSLLQPLASGGHIPTDVPSAIRKREFHASAR
jgi:hypothetical protein